jgi:hypothetical protein
MRWVGICERAFDLMCSYASRRELSPGVLLGSRQNVQEWIAESRAEINAARLLVLQTARAIDRQGAAAVRKDISLIKFFVAGILQKVLDRAIQVHGALGLTDATLLSYWYRHERAARIYDGRGAQRVEEIWETRLIAAARCVRVKSYLMRSCENISPHIFRNSTTVHSRSNSSHPAFPISLTCCASVIASSCCADRPSARRSKPRTT